MITVCQSLSSHLCSNSADCSGKICSVSCYTYLDISVSRKHSNRLPPPSSFALLDCPPLLWNSSSSLVPSAASFILSSVLTSGTSMTHSTRWRTQSPWLSGNSILRVSELLMKWLHGSSLPFQVTFFQHFFIFNLILFFIQL